MEEDIKILEKITKEIIYEDNLNTFENESPINIAKAIENLINRVKELEQEEKELEHLLTSQLGFNLYRDYIPKSKIKEKIKELEKQKDNEYLTNYYGTKEPQRLKEFQYKIQVLQDLLK